MRDQDKILYFLKVVGPTIPSKVAKNIGTEILLASAHLSDLAAQGKVKVSNLKIGGTPLYYLAGQEEQLYHFAAGNLNPKDYQVLEALKQQKILRENALDLLSKVALRSLKDFAIPLQVTVAGSRELFWKWHMLSDEEASTGIKKVLFVKPEAPAIEEQPTLPQALQSNPQDHPDSAEQLADDYAIQLSAEQAKELAKISPVNSSAKDETEDLDQDLSEEPKEELHEKIEKVLSRRGRPKGRKTTKNLAPQEPASDDFFTSAESFLTMKEIIIQEKEIIRKNAETNMLIKVPSAVGTVTYFCKAKKKAKCDEGDVSAAYMEAQIKKLPLLFLYTNELTKKAQEMLATDAFQNALVAKMEKR
ncbi:MAG TPA: hypothetical protein VJB13_03100 [Candidatus Nanoarchaeia archaeon]|nr:hypothetical protein [Candidatus Nanoarchaeia archaeon]